MGIEKEDLRSIIIGIKSKSVMSQPKILILGDAILHFGRQQLMDVAAELDFPIIAQPELPHDVYSLGKALGFEIVHTLDINGKATITQDLQDPLPENLLGHYDFVVDAGVLFWCFEPGAVLKNIYRMISVGGVVVHVAALSGFYGRGYYNTHPLLFENFYSANGCQFVHASYRSAPGSLSVWKRFKNYLLGEKVASRYSTPGHVFLGRSTSDEIGFQKQFAAESKILPNNARANLVFKKIENIEPKRANIL